MPSATDDGQLWTPSNVAAAVHSAAPLGRSPTQPDTIWSNEPLLACGPTANSAEPPNGAGDWHQAGYSTSNPPTAVSMKLATLQNGSSAKSQAVATSHCGTDLPWMQATNLCSTRPGAHDRADGYAAHAAARPACQGRMSAASASLASRSSSTSGSSQQDNSTVLQTTSTSSCSSYTNAGSMVSIACSTPHHSEANSRLTHHRSGLPAPQMDVEAATPEGTDNHTGKEEQAPATSHEALVARQVCTAAPSFGSCAHITCHETGQAKCSVMPCRVNIIHRKAMMPQLRHVCKHYQNRPGTECVSQLAKHQCCLCFCKHCSNVPLEAYMLHGCTHQC